MGLWPGTSSFIKPGAFSVSLSAEDADCLSLFNFLKIIIIILLFRAEPEGHGGSQARERIRSIADGLCHSHSNIGSEHVCDLHHSSQQCWILNPLMDISWICLHRAMRGTALPFSFTELPQQRPRISARDAAFSWLSYS